MRSEPVVVALPGTMVIVVHGEHDRARPPGNGEELAAGLPNAEFRLAESGHTPVYETPDLVADAIRDVIARVKDE